MHSELGQKKSFIKAQFNISMGQTMLSGHFANFSHFTSVTNFYWSLHTFGSKFLLIFSTQKNLVNSQILVTLFLGCMQITVYLSNICFE